MIGTTRTTEERLLQDLRSDNERVKCRECSYAYRMNVNGARKDYLEFPPCPALAPYVSVFWATCSFGEQVPAFGTRVLPDGCIDIIFDDEAGSGLKAAQVIGAMTAPIVAHSQGIADAIAVRFRPGGAIPFLMIPVHEITDSSVSWNALLGADTFEIEERLSQENTISARIGLLEAFLLRRAESWTHPEAHSTLQACMSEIIRAQGRLTVSRLVQRTRYSERHLGRVFRDHVGVSPKRFCELIRFLSVTQSIRKTGCANGAALAADKGYFDQSHLIKEFHKLAGLSPVQFAAEAFGVSAACPILTIQDPARLLYW